MSWPVLSGEASESIWLGQDLQPGQWILAPGGKEFGWQEQKGWLLTGASLLPIGDPLVPFEFLVKFWRVKDWDYFQQFRKKYLTRPAYSPAGNATYAIGIIHPELNAVGISSCVPVITPFFTNNGKGLWTGVVKFKQYRKAQIAMERPRAIIPAAAAPNPAASDALEREQLTHTSQILGGRGAVSTGTSHL